MSRDRDWPVFIDLKDPDKAQFWSMGKWIAHAKKFHADDHDRETELWEIESCTHIKDLNGSNMHESLQFNLVRKTTGTKAKAFAERNRNTDNVKMGARLTSIEKDKVKELPLPIRTIKFLGPARPNLWNLKEIFEKGLFLQTQYDKLWNNCFWFAATVYSALRKLGKKKSMKYEEYSWDTLKPGAWAWQDKRTAKYRAVAEKFGYERKWEFVNDCALAVTGTIWAILKQPANRKEIFDACKIAVVDLADNQFELAANDIPETYDPANWSQEVDEAMQQYASVAKVPYASIVTKGGASGKVFTGGNDAIVTQINNDVEAVADNLLA